MAKNDDVKKIELPEELLWLVDAPSFIDAKQIDSFYDAVVRPYWKQGATSTQNSSSKVTSAAGKVEVGGEVSPGALVQTLSFLLPGMKLNAKAEGSAGVEFSAGEASSTEWLPIETPQRQLEQLAIHYHLFQNERLRIESDPFVDLENKDWAGDAWIQSVPRGLVLLDLPPGTMFIPTYGEYGEQNAPGLVFLKLDRSDDKAYPEKATEAQKRAYWKSFVDEFKVQKSVEALEGGGTGKLQVVDFRVPIDESGRTLHLHPRGEYPTITFAYNLIRRGFEHGVRLVGTMRSEPDMNVLAIYEK